MSANRQTATTAEPLLRGYRGELVEGVDDDFVVVHRFVTSAGRVGGAGTAPSFTERAC